MGVHANPPKACDIPTCRKPIDREFSDAHVPAYGVWGNLCPSCAVDHNVSYGTGLGQRYELKDDGKFHKVEG